MAPIRYTHGHHASVLASHSVRDVENSAAYLLPHLTPDQSLLDVGCGPGSITKDFARRVARVVGLDREPGVLALARGSGAPDPGGRQAAAFLAGDVYGLPFADRSFDVVHAHQVLQHLEDPVAALIEMRRVCRPGGLVAARDADYALMTWFPENPGLDRWLALYRELAHANGAEPDAGRRIFSWARAAGFSEVVASTSTWCFATPESRAWWGGMWAERVVTSSIATQLVERSLATTAELADLAEAWRAWAADPEGWFVILHGEVLATP